MLYDTFSTDYDRFVNWTNRLAVEMPFLQSQLEKAGANHVLDAACGTGMHAIALAQAGFTLAGADLSGGMVKRAHQNAQSAGVSVRFEQAGFGELASKFGSAAFDAVLCLGNSLPHLLTTEDLASALSDFAACLKSGGILLIQNRNFDAVMKNRQRWMEPQSASEGEAEWLFQRFYDFEPNGLLTFNVTTLHRVGNNDWRQSISSAQLRPLLSAEMPPLLQGTGFESISLFGDLSGSPFDPAASGNLVIHAVKAG
jgi:SAM-dependent methyltransferase